MTDRPAHGRPPPIDRSDPDAGLTAAQTIAKTGPPRPVVEDTGGALAPGYKVHPVARIFVRGPWEIAASILIGLGVVMLMQPFFMWAYTYSFIVLLTGTVGFIVVSHFPEGR